MYKFLNHFVGEGLHFSILRERVYIEYISRLRNLNISESNNIHLFKRFVKITYLQPFKCR